MFWVLCEVCGFVMGQLVVTGQIQMGVWYVVFESELHWLSLSVAFMLLRFHSILVGGPNLIELNHVVVQVLSHTRLS